MPAALAAIRRAVTQAVRSNRRAPAKTGGGRTSAGTSRKSAAGEYGKQANFFFSRQQPKTDRRATFSRHKSKVGGRRIRQASELLLQPAAVKTDRRATFSRHKAKVGGKRKTAAGKIQPEAAKERPTGGLRQANKAVTEIRQAKNDLRRVKDG